MEKGMFQAKDAFNEAIVRQKPAELWSMISPHYCVDEASWLQELVQILEEQSGDYPRQPVRPPE